MSNQTAIETWDRDTDGELSEEAMRLKLENRGYTVSRYVYPPGTFFPDHSHTVDKIDAVLAGRFRITTPSGSALLQAGDCLIVPKGMVHSAAVVGDEAVVSLDAIKA
jgi:quercetin dioxygenase-like cupin family protein